MTDNEIIKALECCANATVKESTTVCLDCCFCPHEDCTSMMADAAYQLINRQKAELETWKEAFNNLDKIARPNLAYVENAKSEAIREFAEKLKANMVQIRCGGNKHNVITEHGVDYYVKEMVGEE